jgi:hypothetical protein
MSKICSECGQELPDGAEVCNLCGAELRNNPPRAAPMPDEADDTAFDYSPAEYSRRSPAANIDEPLSLLDYIAEVFRCEQAVFTGDNAILKLNEKIAETKAEKSPEPTAPIFEFNMVGSFLGWLFPVYFPAAFICVPILLLMIESGSPAIIVFGVLLCVCIWFGLTLLVARLRKKSARKKHDAAYAAYTIELGNYPQLCRPYDDKIASLQSEIGKTKAFISATKKVLSELYALNILFSKYRNLVAVSSIYEYLRSGRCVALEGHDGAYNIFENEIRQDIIIIQLDRAIAKLEEIRQTQYMLYDAVQESNMLLIQANKEMQKIGASSALTAYYSGQTAKNSETLVNLNRDKYNRLVTKGGRVIG